MNSMIFKPTRLTMALSSAFIVFTLAGCSPGRQVVLQAPAPATQEEAAPVAAAIVEVAPEAPDESASLTDATPERLVLAARYGQADLVRYLLDGGMDVNAKDAYGNTALISAAGNGQAGMVQLLLARGAKVDAANNAELSALMGAAVKGDFELVHSLIQAGANVNAKNNEGETALFLAVKYGHYKATKVLLNAAAKPNLRNNIAPNYSNSGFTPLMYAANHGLSKGEVDWPALAQLLLENGADPNITNSHGEAALDFARNINDQKIIAVLQQGGARDEKLYAGLNLDEALLKAARGGDSYKARQVLNDGANANFADKNGVTPLLAAAYEGQLALVQQLVAAKAEVNFVPSGLRQFAMSKSHAPLSERDLMEAAARGDTALNAALRQGHTPVVEYLLEQQARIGLPNRQGETPLFVATNNGNAELVKLLLAKGADANTLEQENHLDRLAQAKQAMGKNSVLIVAVQKGHLDVAQALVGAGADIDYRGFMGKTALYNAVESGRRPLVQYLLEQKANANITTLAGVTPLMEAAQKGNRHIAADLLASGSEINAIERPETGFGRDAAAGSSMTALMYAARGGHESMVELLLKSGAETNIRNAGGKRARDEAADGGYESIVRLLDPNSASVTLKSIGQ